MLKYGEVNFNICATCCVFFVVVDQVISHVNVLGVFLLSKCTMSSHFLVNFRFHRFLASIV